MEYDLWSICIFALPFSESVCFSIKIFLLSCINWQRVVNCVMMHTIHFYFEFYKVFCLFLSFHAHGTLRKFDLSLFRCFVVALK